MLQLEVSFAKWVIIIRFRKNDIAYSINIGKDSPIMSQVWWVSLTKEYFDIRCLPNDVTYAEHLFGFPKYKTKTGGIV